MPVVTYVSDCTSEDSTKRKSYSFLEPITRQIKSKEVSRSVYVGLVLAFIGSLILIIQPYEWFLKKSLVFREGAPPYIYWRDDLLHIEFRMHVFNITNKEAFLDGREKLRLEEVGPYIYQESLKNYNATFNHDNGTISSSPRYTLSWDCDQNTRSEEDNLTVPNIAMLLFSSKMTETMKLFALSPLNAFIKSTGSFPIVKQTAKEFLFGYENAFTRFGHTIIPFWITFEKVGLIDRLYDQEGDTATTYTGETDHHPSGLFATYNHLPNLSHWKAPCNKLEGSSDGKKFGGENSFQDTVYLYRKGICRALPFVPIGIATINGIPTFEYAFEENMFDNGEANPKNKCFCRNDQCLPNTLQDTTDCYYGFKMVTSFPHFYGGSPSLREPFEGLNPNETLHKTILHIEPKTGYLIDGFVKIQLNAALDDLSGVAGCERFSNIVLPLGWAEIGFSSLPPKQLDDLFLLLRILPAIQIALACFLLAIGSLIIFCGMRPMLHKSDQNETLDQNSNLKKGKNSLTSNDASELYRKEAAKEKIHD